MKEGDCVYVEQLQVLMQLTQGGHDIMDDGSDPSFGELYFARCAPDALPSPLKIETGYGRFVFNIFLT